MILDHSLKDPSALQILEAIRQHVRPMPAVLFALRGAPDSESWAGSPLWA